MCSCALTTCVTGGGALCADSRYGYLPGVQRQHQQQISSRMPPTHLLRRRSGSIKPEGCGLFGVCRPELCLPPSVDSLAKKILHATRKAMQAASGFENEAKMRK